MTTTCEVDIGCLLDIQQSDGGWAYSTNSSWTEPTCYSVLALRSTGGLERNIGRACEWLARRQRKDGGWSPGPAVEQSTHVTSLGVLALSGVAGYEDIADRGVRWLLTQSGAESSILARVVRFAMGVRSSATEHAGWPWFSGTAAWVIPTSLAICALSWHKRGRYGGDIAARVEEARQFLLSRRCPDQGWNHGGQFREGETPVSYPETTGIALLALRGTKADLSPSLRRGEEHLRNARSSEGESWLRLGLLAQGHSVERPMTKYRDWTVNQVALRIITQAGDSGRNPFLNYE
jgi:Prenyltransferase and squalene oxidase repeat